MSDSMAAARHLVADLAAAGVHRFVVCPGSRSGPIAHALAEALAGATGAPTVEVVVRHDERSAGFVALGMTRESGAPAAVVTTSGTAVGNLVPAAMEASHSGLPLVLVTADRPPRLRGTGANQTTHQPGIFGHFARVSADLRDASDGGWRLATDGPTHLNVAFDEPLESAPGTWPEGRSAAETPRSLAPAETVPPVARGILVAGDLGGAAAAGHARAAAALSWVVLAEPSSGARVTDAAITGWGNAWSRGAAQALWDRAEAVAVVGRPTLTKHVHAALCALPQAYYLGGWGDERELPGNFQPAALPSAGAAHPDTRWVDEWRQAAAEGGMGSPQEEVAAAVVRALEPGALLFVGASLAARAVEATLPSDAGLRIHSSRGLAGIDGSVSTALGLAQAAGEPVTALLGDVTFLHDAGSLLIGSRERVPDLRLVVLNDGGGRIFDRLGHAHAAPDVFARMFTTPHGADIGAIARAYGARHTAASPGPGLDAALATPVAGIEVVEALLDG